MGPQISNFLRASSFSVYINVVSKTSTETQYFLSQKKYSCQVFKSIWIKGKKKKKTLLFSCTQCPNSLSHHCDRESVTRYHSQRSTIEQKDYRLPNITDVRTCMSAYLHFILVSEPILRLCIFHGDESIMNSSPTWKQ